MVFDERTRGRGKPAGLDPLTVGSVAKKLRVSVRQVRRLHERGELTAERDKRTGGWLYDYSSVLRCALRMDAHSARGEGELHARAFTLFGQGRDVRDVVIELKEPIDVVRRLFAEWVAGDVPPPPPPAPASAPEKVELLAGDELDDAAIRSRFGGKPRRGRKPATAKKEEDDQP